MEAERDLEPELVCDTEAVKLPVAQVLLVELLLTVPELLKLALPVLLLH